MNDQDYEDDDQDIADVLDDLRREEPWDLIGALEAQSSPVYISFSESSSSSSSDNLVPRDSTTSGEYPDDSAESELIWRARRAPGFYRAGVASVLAEDFLRESDRIATESELRAYYDAFMRHYISFLSNYASVLRGSLDGDSTAPSSARELIRYSTSQLDALYFSYMVHLRRLQNALSGSKPISYSMSVAYRVQFNDPVIKKLDMSKDGEFAEVDPRDVISDGFIGGNREVSLFSIEGRPLPLHTYTDALADQLRVNTWLDDVNVSGASLGQRGVDIILRAFYDVKKSRNRTVYGNSTVRSLNVGSNNPESEFYGKFLAEMVRNNDSIMSLHLANLDVRNKAMRLLSQALRVNVSIVHLDLSNNHFGIDIVDGRSFPDFCEMLRTDNNALRSINLANSHLTFPDMDSLPEALEQNGNVHTLNLSSNRLGLAAPRIAQIVERARSVSSLDVSNCRMDGAELALLFAALRANPHQLVYLNVADNKSLHNEKAARDLGLYTAESRRLRTLDISATEFGHELLRAHVLPGLGENDSIVTLKMTHTQFGERGFTQFGRLLETNRTLRYLNVNSSFFTPKALTSFSKVFERDNNMIQRFDARRSLIEDTGATALFESLVVRANIVHLDLSGNHIGRKIQVRADVLDRELRLPVDSNDASLALAKLIARSTSLRHLDLSGNMLRDEQVAIIGASLSASRSLRYLNMSNTRSTIEGDIVLIDALDRNYSIVAFSMSFGDGPIGADMKNRVRAIIERNKSRHLKIGLSLVSLALRAARAIPTQEFVAANMPPTLIEMSNRRLEQEMWK